MDVLWARNLLRPADFGGSRYQWEVTQRLAMHADLRVVTSRPRGPLPAEPRFKVHYYDASTRTPFHTFATHAARSRAAIRATAAVRKPDVVVLNSWDAGFGYFFPSSAIPGVPAVYIYHGSFLTRATAGFLGAPLTRFVRYVERRVLRGSTRIVAVSAFSAEEITARAGPLDGRIEVIPTGVDVELFSPSDLADRDASRARLGLGADDRVLLTVGRLEPVKRYDRAIAALATLRAGDARYRLVLAGTGSLEGSLRAQAAPLGDAVLFAGFTEGPALRDLYRAADIVLCTSDVENWSVAILEALSTGTPVIGTPRGGTPDLLRAIDPGLVARDVEPGTFATMITALFARPEELRRLGEAARAGVLARFSWDRTTEQLEACLRRAINEQTAGTRR